ncbi:MAG: phosphatidylglycerophosphatase A [Gammaproteobacteria bacterium]|nr:phosphatidylglycerophosphatase A [Gammaproteobacteria bacterium]
MFLGLGFGSGLAPKAPGTAGTVAAIPLYLLLQPLPLPLYCALTLLAFVAGIYICGETAHRLQRHDHGAIVWDEFVGYWVTVSLLSTTTDGEWWWILLGFLLFRLFDIVKPWPIDRLDREMAGGLGIMVDDLLAGLYALLLLQLLIWLF